MDGLAQNPHSRSRCKALILMCRKLKLLIVQKITAIGHLSGLRVNQDLARFSAKWGVGSIARRQGWVYVVGRPGTQIETPG